MGDCQNVKGLLDEIGLSLEKSLPHNIVKTLRLRHKNYHAVTSRNDLFTK
jgi:hypothetical protein